MRPAGARIVRDVLSLLEGAGESHTVYVDPDDYAGFVQRVAAANGLGWREVNGMLDAGSLFVAGHGHVRRYEWVEG